MTIDMEPGVTAKVANLSISASSNLSRRAEQTAEAGSENLIWEIFKDLYEPTSNPGGYVNLGVAENVLMHDVLSKHIHDNIQMPTGYLTYNDGPTGSKRLKNALCHFLNRNLHPVRPIEPAHLAVTNGVTSAIEQITFALTDPGDGVLLGRPYYGAFVPDIVLRPKAELVSVDFGTVDPLSLDAITAYREALIKFQRETGRPVRAIVLCHPHNPLGRCYPRDFLTEMMKLCQEHRIHLVSDEIYALSVWENKIDTDIPSTPFESALTFNLTTTTCSKGGDDEPTIIDPSLLHVLWGMSKDFGANGLRLGVIISQSNPRLHAYLQQVGPYSYPSQIAEHVVSNILEDDAFTDEFLQTNRNKLAEAYKFVVTFLKKNGIPYAQGANAAFFVWVDLGSAWRKYHPDNNRTDEGSDIGRTVMKRLLAKRVFLADGAVFGSEKSGWFRIVFSQSRELVELGLERILSAVRDD